MRASSESLPLQKRQSPSDGRRLGDHLDAGRGLSLLLYVIVHTITDASFLALLALVGQVVLPAEFARVGSSTVLTVVLALAALSALTRLVRHLVYRSTRAG